MSFRLVPASALALILCFAFAADAGEIVSVYPTGSVKKVQQVTAHFSTDMVALGDPRSKTDPLKLECNLASKKEEIDTPANGKKSKFALPKYTTRWADTKTWSLDFEKPLDAGVQCKLSLNDVKDLKGDKVSGLATYTFSTAGPALLGVAPRYGEIEPDQYFVLRLDGEVQTKSIEQIAYFEADGMPDKIGVKVIASGADHDAVIRAAILDNWEWNEFRKFAELKKPLSSIPQLSGFIVIAGTRRFPEDKAVALHWPKGILSKSGLPVDEAQSYEFKVIPPFEARFSCERMTPDRPCNPLLNQSLAFTRRLKISQLRGTKLVGPKGDVRVPIELSKGDQNQNVSGTLATGAKSGVGFSIINQFEDQQVSDLTFQGPFPERTSYQLVLPKGLKDELGRPLVNAYKFPLAVATDEYSPLVKFAAPFGLLEANAEPVLPVSVRNVEKQIGGRQQDIEGRSFVMKADASPKDIIAMVRAVQERSWRYEERGTPLLEDSKSKPISVPKPGGERDFELIGIPLKETGLHVVELQSPKLGAALLGGGTMYVSSAALVTNLAVHFKKGRESSAVWVTQLDTGTPVANASVGVYLNSGKEIGKGTTDASGLWRVGPLNYPCARGDDTGEGDERSEDSCEVFAFAKVGHDVSFVSSAWSKGIEEYRFNLTREYLSPTWGPIVAHTILDRALLQAGDTINMKHLLREHTMSGFRALASRHLPKRVLIVHEGSRKTFTLPFQYDAKTGSALSTFKVPKDAPLGLYNVYLSNRKDLPAKESDENDPFDWEAKSTANFLVAEYRLPLMESTVKIQGEPLIQPKDVKVDLSASYLSGGPAKNLPIKIRASLGSESFRPDIPGGSDYTFFSEPVKVGLENEETRRSPEETFVFTRDLKLANDGGAATSVTGIPAAKRIRSLVVEMEYRDPNGEIKTATSSKIIYPSRVIVGLRSDSWIASPGKVSVAGVLTDEQGHPKPNRAYTVEAYRRDEITHRKRLVGGFYAYDSKAKTVALGQVCAGKSDRFGRFVCDAKNMQPGSIILQAKALDDRKNATYASVSMSVYGSDQNMWWSPSDSDRIDILPEKTKYEPGETATFAVRSPFPTSTVLVTIEREGVIDAFTREITRDQSTIEVPIKPGYAPNVFVSMLAVRGRVGEPSPTALVDLAKPAMKLGMTELKIGWKAHELKVTVSTDQKRYHARDKVTAKIKVVRADGKPMPADSEVSLVAIDEALGRLRRNWSFDLLSAMMGQRGLAVDTSTGQNQVIGKRHFGSKAKPPGGGGGAGPSTSREFFDPMLLWNGKLKLDANGEAQVSFPLNDSLTSFQIAAAATGGLDFFGDGSTRINSTKDLIIYSGFAPLVRDGDVISNRYTIRNTTEKAMQVQVSVQSAQIKTLPSVPNFELKAGEARTLEIPVTVPAGLTEAIFEIAAKDTLTGANDAMKAKVKVDVAVPDRVLQATLFQLDKTATIPIQQPKDALPNRGGVDVKAQETLVRGLATVKSYMDWYPYSCLEQKVSKAIVAENKTDMKAVLDQLPSYFDSYGLMKFFPSSICGQAQLSRYVLNIAQENGYTLPAATLDRATDGLKSWLHGMYECRSWWDQIVRDNYVDQERLLVMETLSRYGKFNPADLQSIKQTPNLWATETVAAWFRLLEREKAIPQRDELLKQATNILRARVNYQGTAMNLQGAVDWEGQWKLFTSRDQEMLSVFGISVKDESWRNDAGKMARGLIARQKLGKWDTTLANAWAITYLRQFSAKFESVKVGGLTTVMSPQQKESFDWTKNPTGGDVRFAWPTGAQTAPVDLSFSHAGAGKPWMLVQARAAIPIKTPWDLGYKISRKLIPVMQKTVGKWSDGDVVNVELTVTAKYDQPWVVIRDPVPAGATHLGSGLEGGSAILNFTPKQKTKPDDPDSWPTEFEERSNAFFTSYAAYLPRGTYRVNYRIRLNSSGTFRLPPSRVEAMYSPETFGESPNGPWLVQP